MNEEKLTLKQQFHLAAIRVLAANPDLKIGEFTNAEMVEVVKNREWQESGTEGVRKIEQELERKI